MDARHGDGRRHVQPRPQGPRGRRLRRHLPRRADRRHPPAPPPAAAAGPGVSLNWNPSGNWWPGDLGIPASTGGQNNLRYAWFPGSRRLAVDLGGKVWVYDTGDHSIGGVSQQQSGGGMSLTFTSQYGVVDVSRLPVVHRG